MLSGIRKISARLIKLSKTITMKIILFFILLFFTTTISAGDICTFIDLRKFVNQGIIDEVAGDGKGGWTDFGKGACFRDILPGTRTFKDGIVPFEIIDPLKNDGKSVIVLRGPEREGFPEKSKKIAVNANFESLFFLHTAMYASQDETELVKYVIHYEDNSEVVFACRNKMHLADWWDPSEFLSGAMRTYQESSKWLINTPWKNPTPAKKIEWIQMESTGNAIPVLLAITGASTSEPQSRLMVKINERIEMYENANLKIALLQIRSQSNQKWNIDKGTEFVKKAAAEGADIALFPEMYNIGYLGVDFDQPGAIEKWKGWAVNAEGSYVKHFQRLAKELNMAIALSYLEDIGEDKLPRNSVSLIDRNGNIVFTYAKVHTCDFANLENACTPGDGFFVKELDTKAGPVKIGMMICYDRESPESARILMLNGAEIILTPNACDLENMRLCQFRVRAFENAVATVMTNYGWAVENKRFNGHSCIFDADGTEIFMAPEEEGVYLGTLNIYDIRKYRETTIWGNAFRRPHKYKKLISPEVDPVFKRKDSFDNEFKRLER